MNFLNKSVGIRVADQWHIVVISVNETPDGILHPPLELHLDTNIAVKFKKITESGNWLYEGEAV